MPAPIEPADPHGYQEGRRDAGSPLRFRGARAMTLLDRSAPESLRERNIPVLATERLILRAPCFEDARTIAALANDRRIAENTLRIPHPYGLADAQSFITAANASDGEIVFLIATRGGDVIGGCGVAPPRAAPPPTPPCSPRPLRAPHRTP